MVIPSHAGIENAGSTTNGDIYFSLPTAFRVPTTPEQLARFLNSTGSGMAILGRGWTGHFIIAARPLAEVSIHMTGGQCALTRKIKPDIFSATWTTVEEFCAGTISQGLQYMCNRMEAACAAGQAQDTAPLPDGVGWIGHISYDAGRGIEIAGNRLADSLAIFQCYQHYYILIDSDRWLLVTAGVGGAASHSGTDEMRFALTQAATEHPTPLTISGLISPDRLEYTSAVRRAKQYIADGDIYQINISRRWEAKTADPLALWAAMYAASPGRYSAFISGGRRVICSTSPELFLSRCNNQLMTKPIKGTYPRNEINAQQDQMAMEHLLQSPKERAELAMISDLLRNDLGRVCQIGSVKLLAERQIECLPAVWQTYASITGESNLNWGDILCGMLPGGSITGVPKIRAMQIIDELEHHARGIYCGNIGWLRRGVGCFNIAIRTAVWEAGRFEYSAGAGIVADSDAEKEYDEICAKARVVTGLTGGGAAA